MDDLLQQQEFDQQDKEIIKEIKQQNDYFNFLGKQISQHEISSMLPFFDCEEPGHDGNALDQVCLDSECRYKGLCCVRCQYQRHRNHPNSVYPLHTFVSLLITQLSTKKISLNEQMKKCVQNRDVVLSVIKEYLNGLIDHMTDFVSQLHKYYTTFENSYESLLIRSQIVVHSLIYKKHIRRDKFQKYVRDGVKCVQFEKEPSSKGTSEYYKTNSTLPQGLENKFKQEQGEIVIGDQERASNLSSEYISDMQYVTSKLQKLTKRLLSELNEQGQLFKIQPKIPRFEKVTDLDELVRMKQQFRQTVDNVIRTPSQHSMDNNDILGGMTQNHNSQFQHQPLGYNFNKEMLSQQSLDKEQKPTIYDGGNQRYLRNQQNPLAKKGQYVISQGQDHLQQSQDSLDNWSRGIQGVTSSYGQQSYTNSKALH